ncbi:bifunctional protein FolD [Firmicutes bacterium CAG:882]|nr:bifunctional protein FolD [Firmicutes bacterium CAG:882]
MVEYRGMPAVKAMAEEFKSRVAALKERGVYPKLAVVRAGEREDDIAYEKGIMKRFGTVEAEVEVIKLPIDIDEESFEETIRRLNEDEKVHGILVFRPLPKQLDDNRLKEIIRPDKDVDSISMANAAKVFAGDKTGYAPCTAQAVMELLEHNKIDLTGKKVAIVGRSLVVGKPLAMLMLGRNATVTVCHTRTKNIAEECKRADILVACAGSAKMIKRDFTNPDQIVVDVGINFVDGAMCGDVDYDDVAEHVAAITPVPGGVGTVTTSVLLKHTLESAERR